MLQYAYSINTVVSLFFFFFNDTATTEIYTLSLHDALPISRQICRLAARDEARHVALGMSHLLYRLQHEPGFQRSEEHTSELQSPCNLVCRLLLEKKKITKLNANLTLNIITSYPTDTHTTPI